ncbi:MerR family transcriptional regulator [Catellatospora sp. TT07R-123]|uniref:MerR family transcriptional regulator n=1 Tax=Catellatospora sp. TT07R-123 TaxID=2733863 RepID=UPI001BB3F8D1|nr:MerR family transcriptional regulator [Catellatospora sp. TT07R-123]
MALMRIGELAAAAGVSNRTVDFYTNLGLISPASRTSGGFRLYDPAVVEQIATVQRLESSGMSLEEIAAQLRAGGADLAAVLARLDTDLAALRELAEAAAVTGHGLAASLAVRANQLITLAAELLAAMPNG